MNFVDQLDSNPNRQETVEYSAVRVQGINSDNNAAQDGSVVLAGDCLVNQIVLPADVTEINPNDDTIYIVGTKTGKVTKIAGLEVVPELKVCLYCIIYM